VQVIRQIFTALPKKTQNYTNVDITYTGLLLLVRIRYEFHLRSINIPHILIQEVLKKFLKRRSMTHTILEGIGYEVSLIKGKEILNLHFHGKKIKEGITVFPSKTGINSKIIELFFKLDRVPSRFIQDFIAPDLPVFHSIGTRIDNPNKRVGFPNLSNGSVLICGSNNKEVILLLQNLAYSFISTKTDSIFIIDPYNELNGLAKHLNRNNSAFKGKEFQLYQLGTNMFVNICDVIIPYSPTGEKRENETIAAWKSYLISQILLNSLKTSYYLTSRFSIPLEAQIHKIASKNPAFSLKQVKFTLDGAPTDEPDESNKLDPEVEDSVTEVFADMIAVDQLKGILDHFKAFSEINYEAFTGHLSDTLLRPNTVTIFQFGPQPPMIKRAVVNFLLQFLSQSIKRGCVILPHSDEFLSQRTSFGRTQESIPSMLIESCNQISRNNVLILGSQSLQGLASTFDSFEEIRNQIYLRLANTTDRDLVITQHQLKTGERKMDYQQKMGVMEGEGLLFRSDAPANIAYHFKINEYNFLPIDPIQLKLTEIKRRGSSALGLAPKDFKILMQLMKVLHYNPLPLKDAQDLIANENVGEHLLRQFQSLDLYRESIDSTFPYWVMTETGRDFYEKQLNLLDNLKNISIKYTVNNIGRELQGIEGFYESSGSVEDRRDINLKVKNLIAHLLHYVIEESPVTPWNRIAEYQELENINGLEQQDFIKLFTIAASLNNDLILEYNQLKAQFQTIENQRQPQTSERAGNPKKLLDTYLPDKEFLALQVLSKTLKIAEYPKSGVIEIYFKLKKQDRSLIEELKKTDAWGQ
jgi:hypothetical protein